MSVWSLNILLQILDGILTYIGVSALSHGIDAEGNPIVKFLMRNLGPGTALLLVKGFAVSIIFYLRNASSHLVMLKVALYTVNLLYLISAVLWIYVFCITKG